MVEIMERVERMVGRSAFGMLAAVLLAAPWCFGAWEAWWFWPFVTLLFLASAVFGMQLLLDATREEQHAVTGVPSGGRRRRRRSQPDTGCRRWQFGALAGYLLFLTYAGVRMIQAPVFTDAQRSFLLFFTALMIGCHVVYGLDSAQRHLLFKLILVNLLVLGLYGIINHAVCGSRLVLGRAGYPQYVNAGRASGSYLCPDHFAGIMELALCLALGLICSRGSARVMRVIAILTTIVALTGILLSKSRGAGLTTLVIFGGVWLWGLRTCRPRLRWILRGVLPFCGVLLIGFAAVTGSGYFKRFSAWFGWDRAKHQPISEAVQTVSRSVQNSSRWMMLSGAMRAWKKAPLVGIGPGMHQSIWPHVAASGDGDIAQHRWPSRLNNTRYSYEVHNDWAQLLEEYGLIGLALFLIAAVTLSGSLLCGARRAAQHAAQAAPPVSAATQASAMVLGAWLAALAMGFHSFGDFNLQMPATTWLFAAIIGLGIRSGTSRALSSRSPRRKGSSGA